MATKVSSGEITIVDVNDGGSFYTATVYAQQVGQPDTPSGGSYNFSTQVLTVPTDPNPATNPSTGATIWSASIPTSTTTPTWAATYTFSIIPPNTSSTGGTWGTPVLFVVNGTNGTNGTNGISAILSNESFTFPATSTGVVGSYTGSGTNVYVYEGATQLSYDGVGTSARTWTVTSTATNITRGSLTDSGTYLTVGDHSGVANNIDTSSITYTITGKSANNTAFTIVKSQTFSKSKAGTDGQSGLGSTVSITSNREVSFTATDGTIDAGQADIIFTANIINMTSPIYSWSFSGFQTAPSNSGTSSQTISATHFGTSKSAKVTVTVTNNSQTYTDDYTIVRLEKSSAAAGATVGADSSNLRAGVGTNLLPNTTFLTDVSYWTYYTSSGTTLTTFSNIPPGNNGSFGSYGGLAVGFTAPNGSNSSSVHTAPSKIPCVAGQRLEAQCLVKVFRGLAQLEISFQDINGNYLTSVVVSGGVSGISSPTATWDSVISSASKLWGFVIAPTNAIYAYLEVRLTNVLSPSPDIYVGQPYIGYAGGSQTTATPWSAGTPRGAFANLNKITASNVTTYIDNVAINSAQIADAAITNAKIDRASVNKLQVVTADIVDANVSTLKIAGNAVTVPMNAYTMSWIGLVQGIWTTVQTLTVPVLSTTETTPLIIPFGLCYTVDYGPFIVRLLSGSTVLYEAWWLNGYSFAGGLQGNANINYTLPANTSITLTLSVLTGGSYNGSADNRYISCLGARR